MSAHIRSPAIIAARSTPPGRTGTRVDDRLVLRVGGPQRDLAAAFRFDQDRPDHHAVPRPARRCPRRRTAPGAKISSRSGSSRSGRLRTNPYASADVRGEHAAAPQQVVDQLHRLFGGEQAVVRHVEAQRHDEVVEQVLRRLRARRDDVDAVLGEMVAIADAGQHQQLRAVDGAAAQHHLAPRVDDPSLAELLEFHTRRPGPVEQDPGRGGPGEQRQVLAAASPVSDRRRRCCTARPGAA